MEAIDAQISIAKFNKSDIPPARLTELTAATSAPVRISPFRSLRMEKTLCDADWNLLTGIHRNASTISNDAIVAEYAAALTLVSVNQ